MRNRSGCGLLCVVGRHTRPSPLRSGCRLCRTWVFLHGISLAGSNGRRPTSPTAPPSPLLPPTLPRLSIEDADVAVSCGIGHSGHAVDAIPSSRCRSTPRAPSERPGRGASTGQAITSAPLIRFRNEAIRPICGRCQRAGLSFRRRTRGRVAPFCPQNPGGSHAHPETTQATIHPAE
jgi:hypothetical protein